MISHKALVVLSVIFCIIICCNGDLKGDKENEELPNISDADIQKINGMKRDKGNEGKKEFNPLFQNIHKTLTRILKPGKNKNKALTRILKPGDKGNEALTNISEAECNDFLLKVGFHPDLGIYNIIFIYQFDDVDLFMNHVQSILISTENGAMLAKIKEGLKLYYEYSVKLRSKFISSFKENLKTPEEFCTLVGIKLDPECKKFIKQYEFELPNISDADIQKINGMKRDKGNEENNKFKSYLTSINIAYTYISENGDKGNEGKKEFKRLFENIKKKYTYISENGYEKIESYTYIPKKALTHILKADIQKINGMKKEVFEYYQKLLCMSVELYKDYATLTTSYLCELISQKMKL